MPSPEAMHRVLLYGTEASRRLLAESIARDGDELPAHLAVLAETIRSDAPDAVRARCAALLKLIADQLWPDPQGSLNEAS